MLRKYNKMLRIIFILLLCSCCISGQNSRIKVTTDDHQGKKYWLLHGSVPLPDQAILSIRISFQDTWLPGSIKSVRVKEGQFVLRYLLVGKILDGEYNLIVAYNPKIQFKGVLAQTQTQPFNDTHVFQMGESYQERAGRRKFRHFLNDILNKIMSTVASLERDSLLYLSYRGAKKRTNIEKVKAWEKSITTLYQNWQTSYLKNSYPYVLVPYSKKSMDELKHIIDLMSIVNEYQTKKVLTHYKLYKPIRGRIPSVRFKRSLHKITLLNKTIRKRESFPSHLSLEDLEQDLLWFRKVYVALVKDYQSQLNKFDHNIWQKSISLTKQEMAEFQLSSQEYLKSKLHQKHTGLENLRRLLLEMMNISTQLLYQDLRSRKAVQIKQLQQELELQFLELYSAVAQAKEKSQKSSKDDIAYILETLNQVESLEQNLVKKWVYFIEQKQSPKGMDLKRLQKWQKFWQGKLVKLQQRTKKINQWRNRKALAGYPTNLRYFYHYLRQMNNLYNGIIEGKKKPGDEQRIKQYHHLLQSKLNLVRQKLEK